jgi:hypothetical protein
MWNDDHQSTYLFEYVLYYVDKLDNHYNPGVHNNDCPGCLTDPFNPTVPGSGDGPVQGRRRVRHYRRER